ncbi:alpha/beta hydrolase [Geodermatophilus sabuli]|uniref:Alpha/beta hydrolase fold n=1 Tax=Geodermatophilus sabuli TaxID=1564158 RepID=A0A285EEM0_9ACTN|nr:alpha/beta hydrolase [Geodermatophilus sabuli]MBB3084239.1 pimeloyl-ACP methyl ester carboxylesterase [Geodermatophilus sabuli]SNX96491.1 alpha/beta hydrolase fold [Geodermatophilus sabuli]
MLVTTCRRTTVIGVVAVLTLGTGSAVAGARAPAAGTPAAEPVVPTLTWTDCGTTEAGTAAGVQCATATLPLDHDDPAGAQVQIALARVPAPDQAARVGSLFLNFGGPGGTTVDVLQAAGAAFLPGLSGRFDVIGFDPRGVGQSSPAIDCGVNQETEGIYSIPAPTPLDIDVDAYVAKAQGYVDACLANGPVLEHVSTANVARDMDLLRAAVGDEQLSYLGFSYGTFLGATYATLFPDRYRTMVLDGAIDAEEYVHDPLSHIAEQTAGFEQSLARFAEACAVDQVACSGFGGADPYLAFDQLVAAANEAPIPADGYPADPRAVTGDDILTATLGQLYAKRRWGTLAAALAQAAAGDGSAVRAIVDGWYGRRDDGSYSPGLDRYFTIGASEQRYPRGDLEVYLDRGAESWASFPHFWSNSGYAEINYGLWPVSDEDAFAGPFTVPASSPPVLVIGTTYDPATPYPWAQRLTAQLGNARLLTMEGDNHTAYLRNSGCITAAADVYLLEGTLPAEGTVCRQEVPFVAPAPAPVEAPTAVRTDVLGSLLTGGR